MTAQNRKSKENMNYHRTKMQKEMVLQILKERGCRITKQRKMLLDVILQEECSCCKEIYYRALETDPDIGFATVYRMVNLLEEIGAISRKNLYKISCGLSCERENACTVYLENGTTYLLSGRDWYRVMTEGLKACGYIDEHNVSGIEVEPCRGC
ncbi:MAG: transcriptional repressor [Lachnospiraceae bacterium]|nr:transcriptional repressor [Lachnospiraceae bacterium]